jgi:hypothetical protein
VLVGTVHGAIKVYTSFSAPSFASLPMTWMYPVKQISHIASLEMTVWSFPSYQSRNSGWVAVQHHSRINRFLWR